MAGVPRMSPARVTSLLCLGEQGERGAQETRSFSSLMQINHRLFIVAVYLPSEVVRAGDQKRGKSLSCKESQTCPSATALSELSPSALPSNSPKVRVHPGGSMKTVLFVFCTALLAGCGSQPGLSPHLHRRRLLPR